MVTSAEHQITSDVVDIRRFFRPINYLGFNILQLQVLCQHLRSTILCARSRLDELKIRLLLRKKIFF